MSTPYIYIYRRMPMPINLKIMLAILLEYVI